jgi:hypothetical protein
VNGVISGSAPIGFISGTGLYTAPAVVPSPATVTVQATSIAMPTVSGSATVTIKAAAAPTISSVTPNPLTTGSFTLTVNGANFQSGAVVRLAGASLATTFVSAAKLTATGSTTTTGSAVPVTVLNADGQVCAAYNIAVKAPTVVAVTVSPTSASVRISHSVSFTAKVTGTTNTRVTWQVNGITGGNATIGKITTAGVYTAPAALPSPATVTVRAVSVADPAKSATASVTIIRKR